MAGFGVEPIAAGITRINVPGDVCAFLAEGADRAALIDTGFGLGSLRSFVRALTDKPLVVILTHGHYDHAGGAGEFEQVALHEGDLPLALAHSQRDVRRQALASSGRAVPDEELVPPLRVSQVVTYASEREYDLGGLTVRMLPLVGHTPGMCCPLFVEERIVLLGDACNSATYLQLDESSGVSAYRASLAFFLERYGGLFDRVLYSHPHNFGGKQIVQEMIDLCDQVLTPGFDGVDMSAVLGPGVLVAKPVNEAFAPADGSCANLVYTQAKVR